MTNNQLQLNNDKTEMILIATKMLLNSLFHSSLIWRVLTSNLPHSSQPRCLSWSYSHFPTANLLRLSIQTLNYLELHRISAIRHYLPEDVTKKLLCAFVLSRLDYCNSLLAGCPKYLLSRLQKVQNNAAGLIFRTRSAHITPMLHFLHWLPTEQRTEYKLSLLCFKIIFH